MSAIFTELTFLLDRYKIITFGAEIKKITFMSGHRLQYDAGSLDFSMKKLSEILNLC